MEGHVFNTWNQTMEVPQTAYLQHITVQLPCDGWLQMMDQIEVVDINYGIAFPKCVKAYTLVSNFSPA